MKKVLKVDKLDITCDFEDILNQVKAWTYDKDSYNGSGEFFSSKDYSFDEEQWKKAKKKFISKIEELQKDETKLISVLSRSISINKNGSITKRRNNVIFDFDCVRDYNNSYGSHSYTTDALMVLRDDDFKGHVSLSCYNAQSSF